MKKLLVTSTLILSLLVCNVGIAEARGGGGTGGSHASSSVSAKPSSSSKPSVNLSKPSATTSTTTSKNNTSSATNSTKPSTSTSGKSQPIINNYTTINKTTKVYPNNTLHIYSVPRTSYYYGGYYHPAFIPYWYHPYYYNPYYWVHPTYVPVATTTTDYVGSFIFTGLLVFAIIGGLVYWFYWRKRRTLN